MKRINRLVVDSTASVTEMCEYGAHFGTDKSPYSETHHRHAYTAIYDLIFASRRWEAMTIGELGILDNMSMHVWRRYFPNARLHGFEFFDEKIDVAREQALPMADYAKVDVGDTSSIFNALNNIGCFFDIIIDDSTHLFEHQINFINVAVDFVKAGGILIVEDVFRDWEEARYVEALKHLLPYFSSATFIETNHANAKSDGNVIPYYNNDKILVLFRNEKRRDRNRPSGPSI